MRLEAFVVVFLLARGQLI
uniref:Uncharacterized protein n=1 Tax=Anguilla anguilla TaxID=7936 RepID=A0A0E9TPI5_ANGAN